MSLLHHRVPNPFIKKDSNRFYRMPFTSSKAYFPCDVDVPVEMSVQGKKWKRNMDALEVSKGFFGHKKTLYFYFFIWFSNVVSDRYCDC